MVQSTQIKKKRSVRSVLSLKNVSSCQTGLECLDRETLKGPKYNVVSKTKHFETVSFWNFAVKMLLKGGHPDNPD